MPILFIILLLTTVEQSAIDIYLPSFPAMGDFFGVDDAQVQLSLSLYMVGFSISPLLAGPLVDRVGRKPMLLSGLSAFVITALMCAWASSISTLLIARIFMGAACGLLVVANQSMVRDSFDGKRLLQVTSYMSMVWSTVPIIAPAIGGVVQTYWKWQGNFYLIALYIFISLLCVLLGSKETMSSTQPKIAFKDILPKYCKLLKNCTFIVYVLCTALSFAITTAFITAAPFIFQDVLGYTPLEFGWIALSISVSYLVATYLNNLLIHHFTPHQLICAGLWMICGFSLLGLVIGLAGIINLYVVAIPVSIVIFAGGFIYPNAAAMAFESINKDIGFASALYISIQLLSCALCSAVVAKLSEQNQVPLMAFLLFLSILSAIIYLFYKRKKV